MKSLKRHISLLLTILCVTIMQAHDSHWSFNFRDYKYDMTIYAQLIAEEGQVSSYDNYEIAAFVGEECRSVGQPQEKDGYKWVYLRVWSNETSGEELTFKLYDRTLDEEIVLRSETVTFQANDQVGQASLPLSLLKLSDEYRVITFDTDGGSLVNPITQKIGEAVTAPENPTKTGYSFAGWDKEIPTTMPAEDMTIKAQWIINQYTISFDTDGGSTIAPVTQDYNSEVTAPENPTKTGYSFAGWDKEIPATMPAENMTIKAQWTINQYTISFDTDGGSTIAPVTQDYNSEVTAPENPTKTGYSFAGWDKEIPTTMPSEDMTIKAQWTINQYTISFDTDGGSTIAPITQDYNTDVTAPEAPTKTGYSFTGWDKEIPATMPAEDMTIKALWTVNTYKLTYVVDGEVYKEYEVEYGATIEPEPEPTREDWLFSGWKEEIPATMPAHDVVITGSFDVFTSITSVEAESSENQVIYNINGVRSNKIRKGLNIVNGRKIIVR